MPGRSALLLVTFGALGLAACSDRQSETPTSPDFAAANKPACSYSKLKQDVNAEWPVSTGGATKDTNTAVNALLTSMQNAAQQNPADSNVITVTGFRIIQSVAIAASTKQAGTTPAAGSTLAIDLFSCMDVPPSSVPGSFVSALGTSGAFGVRARTNTDSDPLDTRDGAWTVSPVGSPWATVAARAANDTGGASAAKISGQAKDLFLIWGQPVDPTNFTGDILLNTGGPSPVFLWSSTPQQTFTATNPPGPGIQVTECVPNASDLGFVQHNSGNTAVILATATVSCPSGVTAYLRRAPNSVLQKLRSFFSPELAYATGGTGPSTKGSHLSPWGVVNPGQLKLTNVSSPAKQSNQVGVALQDGKGQPLSVTPTSAAGTSFGQSGGFVWVEAFNNQGVNVLVCNNWAYTDATGKATFTNMYLNKAGGYTLVFKTLAQVSGGIGTNFTAGNTALFNVKNGTVPNDGGCTGTNVFIFDPSKTTQVLPPPPGPPPVP